MFETKVVLFVLLTRHAVIDAASSYPSVNSKRGPNGHPPPAPTPPCIGVSRTTHLRYAAAIAARESSVVRSSRDAISSAVSAKSNTFYGRGAVCVVGRLRGGGYAVGAVRYRGRLCRQRAQPSHRPCCSCRHFWRRLSTTWRTSFSTRLKQAAQRGAAQASKPETLVSARLWPPL